MNPQNPLVRLAQSRKALIVFFTLTAVVILAITDKITGKDALSLLTVVIPAWLLGQSYEDGQAKGAGSNPSPAPAPPPPAAGSNLPPAQSGEIQIQQNL